MNVVAPRGTSVELDGVPIPALEFEALGRREYVVARLRVADGVHRLRASAPVGVSAYGYDRDVSYAYPAGLDLTALRPEPQPPPGERTGHAGQARRNAPRARVDGAEIATLFWGPAIRRPRATGPLVCHRAAARAARGRVDAFRIRSGGRGGLARRAPRGTRSGQGSVWTSRARENT